MAGERVDPCDMDCVPDGCQLMNGYWPAECSVVASVQTDLRRVSNASNIGHPTGAAFWAVCPHNHQQLVPVGAVCEPLIERA